ncbi:MAG: hypothetical protein LBS67_00625, partial [Clostridiales Family XIII bacterium]|nr:hypothetical protein [Clostridiales Family XIII bacterium]
DISGDAEQPALLLSYTEQQAAGTVIALKDGKGDTLLEVKYDEYIPAFVEALLQEGNRRAAIKDPLDLAFLFWAIAAGIVLAAGLAPLAAVGSLVVAAVLVLFANRKPASDPYIPVVACADQQTERSASEAISTHVRRMQIKSKTVMKDRIELNYEVRVKDDDTSFVNELAAMPGVLNTVLVSYNGDYMG